MAPANTRCTRPLRIVVLDDEPCVREALQLLLRSYLPNSVILTFNDAESALQELEREDPDLFTTDLNHPGRLRGEALLRILASGRVKYPILLITACAASIQQELLKRYVVQGLNIALLSKPFSPDDLRRLVSTHLGLKTASE
jgi:CheY-like chemotaxis protein